MEAIMRSIVSLDKYYFNALLYSVLLAFLLGIPDVILEFLSQRFDAEFHTWMLWLNFFLFFVVSRGVMLINQPCGIAVLSFFGFLGLAKQIFGDSSGLCGAVVAIFDSDGMRYSIAVTMGLFVHLIILDGLPKICKDRLNEIVNMRSRGQRWLSESWSLIILVFFVSIPIFVNYMVFIN